MYSSLSNSFALLDSDTYGTLLKLRDGNQAVEIDSEVMSTLNQMQVVNVDEDMVLNQIRFISQQ